MKLDHYEDINKYINSRRHDIRGLIGIGAHRGQEFYGFRGMGVNNFIMFEPQPEKFEILNKLWEIQMLSPKPVPIDLDSLGEPKLDFRIENLALGKDDGEKTMYVSSNDGQSSSLLKPLMHEELYPGIKFEKEITVKQTSLDKYISENGINMNKFNFICIDVQGYELEVFKGATETLKHIDCIFSEVNNIELYEGCATIDKVDEFLGKNNFKRTVTTMVEDNSWGDAVYEKI